MYVIPFILESGYLYISRTLGKQTSSSDTLGIIGSVIIGSLPLLRMRMSLLKRSLVLVSYILGIGLTLIVFSFIFACVILKDCL